MFEENNCAISLNVKQPFILPSCDCVLKICKTCEPLDGTMLINLETEPYSHIMVSLRLLLKHIVVEEPSSYQLSEDETHVMYNSKEWQFVTKSSRREGRNSSCCNIRL